MPKKFNKSPATVRRRQRVIQRLRAQLVTGYKPVVEDKVMSTIKLSDADRARIEREISILETRL